MPGLVLAPTQKEHFNSLMTLRSPSALYCSVAQSRLTLCGPTDCRPGPPVLHCLTVCSNPRHHDQLPARGNSLPHTSFPIMLPLPKPESAYHVFKSSSVFSYLFMFPVGSLCLEQKDRPNCELPSPTWPEVDFSNALHSYQNRKMMKRQTLIRIFFFSKKRQLQENTFRPTPTPVRFNSLCWFCQSVQLVNDVIHLSIHLFMKKVISENLLHVLG